MGSGEVRTQSGCRPSRTGRPLRRILTAELYRFSSAHYKRRLASNRKPPFKRPQISSKNLSVYGFSEGHDNFGIGYDNVGII